MRKRIIVLLIICILAPIAFSCSKKKDVIEVNSTAEKNEIEPNTDMSQENPYIALSDKEVLKYRIVKIQNSSMIELIVYAESSAGERVLKRIAPRSDFDTSYLRDDRLYYLDGLRAYDGVYPLYFFDANTGEIVDPGILTDGSFDISTNDKFVCYSSNDHPLKTDTGTIYRPVVYLKELVTGESYKYDFSDSFLKEVWGAGVFITFDKEMNSFFLEFAMDSPVSFAQGYISVESFIFTEVKD